MPSISPLASYTAVVPLALVIMISMVREAIEDIIRHRSDRRVNSEQIEVLNQITQMDKYPQWTTINSNYLSVGAIVRINDNQIFPADLALIRSANKECFIQTSSLDGEKSLKRKTLPKLLSPLDCAKITAEDANSNLHSFSAFIKTKNGSKTPLDCE